jgi:hypothetical protein
MPIVGNAKRFGVPSAALPRLKAYGRIDFSGRSLAASIAISNVSGQ